ncbi:hypothetical protein Patl1_02478 [Pistacia atlantica]|uniref:Uncharacterized protein n=1 Tax=Pistacia atlantica TaxID=434234 RepID=A0ACC1CCW9_9ROSI|nr:hypothetical protein Patl1_02478 [Pistacia atlantica]
MLCMNYLNWDMIFMLGLANGSSYRSSFEFDSTTCISVFFSRMAFNLYFQVSVAVGSGWQAVVAYVNNNIASYYIIGLPIGCVISFKTSLGVSVS